MSWFLFYFFAYNFVHVISDFFKWSIFELLWLLHMFVIDSSAVTLEKFTFFPYTISDPIYLFTVITQITKCGSQFH